MDFRFNKKEQRLHALTYGAAPPTGSCVVRALVNMNPVDIAGLPPGVVQELPSIHDLLLPSYVFPVGRMNITYLRNQNVLRFTCVVRTLPHTTQESKSAVNIRGALSCSFSQLDEEQTVIIGDSVVDNKWLHLFLARITTCPIRHPVQFQRAAALDASDRHQLQDEKAVEADAERAASAGDRTH